MKLIDKLRAVFKPLHVVRPAARVEPAAPHPHNFSCQCEACETETARLTQMRLKRQGA